MSVRSRLDRLEKAIGEDKGPRRPIDVLFVDEQDRILFDGNETMRPWVGRHPSELPAEWWEQPWHLRVIKGVDPLEIFGLRDP